MVPMSTQGTIQTQDAAVAAKRAELLAVLDAEREAGAAFSSTAEAALVELGLLNLGFCRPSVLAA